MPTAFTKEIVMATRRIREFLDGSAARYIAISHSKAYTAEQTARSTHISADITAKTVIVRVDGRLAMVVVPASKDIDLDSLRDQIGAASLKLAHETDFAARFEGCQLGAAPPFGNLFGVETFMDRQLALEEEIAFPAGTHTDVIVMRTLDYQRLVRPTLVNIAPQPVAAIAR
jgi:Ala-tRNA(Pro) deacylase